MSQAGLLAAQQKMHDAGVPQAAIDVFTHYYGQLESGVTGMIPEDSIDPYVNPPMLDELDVPEHIQQEAIAKTAIIKLNGGLGTSMGLDRAKTLLEVRDGLNFLDLIAKQVLSMRQRYKAGLPLLFMTSFRTDTDTVQYLQRYPQLAVEGLPLTFQQNQEPKLRADDLTPVQWPQDPSLEWCPPGHGDLYTALLASGVLDALLTGGYRYACISNGDNLGAVPNARIAGWFASTGAPYAAEVCRRTVNDKKGGHLAVRKSDGQLILRDTAQTPDQDMHYFTDEFRHPFFHTNNLWFDLQALRERLAQGNSVLGLPLIRNQKTVDPTRSDSPAVLQIETAMGAAIEVFPGATAICVDRSRFLPVKTTNELLLLRSDVYDLDEQGQLVACVETTPEVSLSSAYKTISEFDRRIPQAPSLREASSFIVKGDWEFGAEVSIRGNVTLGEQGGIVEQGHVLQGEG
ncbi:UTP--glucose-1-phosphate uridylyltransferase [Schaalia sp. lx-260]|uniref:UTP--glucose-1-phosphate uridylyltransferase n=1 Tax=Schaalia sp. lx-260 TaxID=2899082 RepID=UPI001E558D89|nr:UTP--glucose-1-phosphate uridylyltransferase [Schaalia sp. lx-260]MCD4548901.1 UTP--glucose-1-phosphate uridylyltransferase [Schaalia sp. lx-260]